MALWPGQSLVDDYPISIHPSFITQNQRIIILWALCYSCCDCIALLLLLNTSSNAVWAFRCPKVVLHQTGNWSTGSFLRPPRGLIITPPSHEQHLASSHDNQPNSSQGVLNIACFDEVPYDKYDTWGIGGDSCMCLGQQQLSPPFIFLSAPLTLPPLPYPLLSPSLPSPFLSLEAGPLNPGRGQGERCELLQRGVGRSPISRNRIWCI